MALFIPDMAGHLFLVILLFDTFQYIKAQGQYQGHYPKPDITIKFDEDFNIICLIPGSVSPDTTCNLYVGEESQPSFTAKIKKRKATSASGQQFCHFIAKYSDLISRLQSLRSKEVSCDYRVSSGPNSLSSRSDGHSFTETVLVNMTPHSIGSTAPLITTSENSTGNTTDLTLTPMGKEPLDFLWRHILTVLVLLATCGVIIHYFISHQCPKAVPKRSRRVDQSNEDFSLTVC
ncbi:uncharacterized protein LOC112244875 isoform X2 [Oncorhynchus tshawytscha]|uniref:uncharacterized protein LOC112244875 isoform X2 n=1 Tax=Oncorhynchus tshawytscha TaxID=74940 RepID=UPI001C3D885E|nr:uncharacterized protein LOC112244875 isoform X2 [Oncorhynchus tshawytscha]